MQRVILTGKGFLSTPSARRATGLILQLFEGIVISIHALREEGDDEYYRRFEHDIRISIHALREEGDGYINEGIYDELIFLSTPSARRATTTTRSCQIMDCHFYPRPPRGGRP